MDVRAAFLDYFASKNHNVVDSMPLVPDDPTLLFTNAGMVQFKDIFTGQVPRPENPRATSCQLCMRAGGKHNDLENVGYTARHHTLFEMLGNFSFGDYFKEDAIAHAWEFVTEILGFDKNVLWVTVHDSDDEAEQIWQKHIAKDRIKRFGDKDNFWQMGDTGPCGPCSEIFIDQGAEHFSGPEDYLGGDGDRFLEIWNLVFMQYERDKSGNLTPLPKPSIDTGMGLERVVALLEGKHSNYDSSLFMPTIRQVEALSKQTYVYESGASFRAIADHIRSVGFLLSQGVNFGNEGREYVLRRILRRAVRHGYFLGLKQPFMYQLLDGLVDGMGEAYPYLKEKQTVVIEQIRLEEERFYATIESGMEMFQKELGVTQQKLFSGEVAFKLYDTFGFPLDLTQDMLREQGMSVDIATFESLMMEQRERSKAAWKGSGDAAKEGDFSKILEQHGKNEFVGYDRYESDGTVLAMLDSNYRLTDSLAADSEGFLFLDRTPFYAESGGQRGDEGVVLSGDDLLADVIDTRKFFDLNISQVKTIKPIQVGSKVLSQVDEKRNEIAKHHSATHLLHAVLRDVLGDHVSQAGSLVEENRLRFDFSHPKALTHEEIATIEEKVNIYVAKHFEAQVEEMGIEAAKAKGAMALFGEKYGDTVRVVSFGEASIELCGGTHIGNTGMIGSFYIAKESGVSAGVRRIEAVCGLAAYAYAKESLALVETARTEVKNRDLLLGIGKLREQIKELKTELQSAQSAGQKEMKAETVNGVALIVERIEGGDIKQMVDDLKNRHANVAVMLFQAKGDKVLLAAGVKAASIKAGAWIKAIAPIVGGGGGGRDDFAQAGGKDASRLDEALRQAREFAAEALA